MISSPTRLVIIGAGAAARQCHLPALARVPEVQLVALVDPVREHAAGTLNVARSLQVPGVDHVQLATGVPEILGQIDAAIIASPHTSHAPIAETLLRQGVPCLVEKLMAPTVHDCDIILAASNSSGARLAVAHVRRLFPAAAWVYQRLRAGDLGELQSICWREGAPYDWPLVSPSLFQQSVSGGGVLADSGPHCLDMLLWWLQAKSAEILSYRDSSLGGAESEAELELRIAGVPVSMSLSRYRWLANTCTLVGSRCVLEVGLDTVANYCLRDSAGRTLSEGVLPDGVSPQEQWERCFAEQLRNFLSSDTAHTRNLVTGQEGRQVVDLIERCYAQRDRLPMPWREVLY